MQNNQPRKKGFSFLSFFLGILIGIILIVGAVGGFAWYALSANVDTVLNTFGVDNSKDENGNNKVINSDKENGGVETMLELVQKVVEIASSPQELSMGEVEHLIPAVGGVIDGIHQSISQLVEVERSEFAAVKFGEFGEFVQSKVLDIQPASLFESFGMGGMLDNKIINLVFCGTEADYVVNNEDKYPVYYDTYTLENGSYLRANDKIELPAGLQENLVEKNGETRLYYYLKEGTAYITDESFAYAPATRSAVGSEYSLYNTEYAELSGNYYYEDGQKINVTPITLRTLSDGGFDALEEVYLTELLEGSGDDLAQNILGGISLGDVMSGNVDFNGVLDEFPLPDLIEVKADNAILMYLCYGVYEISGNGGLVELNGAETPCMFTVDHDGVVTSVTANGVEISSTPITEINGKINGLTDKLKIKDLIEIDQSNKLMVKIGDSALNGVPNVINTLTIGEIMEVDGNLILKRLQDATISNLPEAVSKLTVNELYFEEIYKIPANDGATKVPAPATDYNGDYLYYTLKNGKYSLVSEGEELGKLAPSQFAAGEHYTYGAAQGIWKFMLTDNGSEKAYSINNLAEMIPNVSNNITNAKLTDLNNSGVVVFDKPENLEKEITYGNQTTTLGELKLEQALEFLISLVGYDKLKLTD